MQKPRLGKIKLLSAKEQVAAVLRKAILSRDLVEGQEITLEGIASMVGVSSMPVREAFQILAADGLIKVRPNKGAVVLGINEQTIREHYEIRALLESEAVAKASRPGTDISRIAEVHYAAEKALAEIAEFDDVDTSILMLRMRGGAMAQLDNTRRTGHGYDERISLLGSDGVLESGSQTTRGVTLWQGERRIQPGLYPDWFSRVEGSYYAHLDAFVRSLGGEEVADLPGLLDGLRAQAIAEAAVLSLQQGQFVSVEPLA